MNCANNSWTCTSNSSLLTPHMMQAWNLTWTTWTSASPTSSLCWASKKHEWSSGTSSCILESCGRITPVPCFARVFRSIRITSCVDSWGDVAKPELKYMSQQRTTLCRNSEREPFPIKTSKKWCSKRVAKKFKGCCVEVRLEKRG